MESKQNYQTDRATYTKADRLLRRTEYLRLAQNGTKVQNRYFIAYTELNQLEHSRLGVTVTRKIGKAAARNRIKRIVRNHFRINRHVLINNCDISIIVKREVAGISNARAIFSLESLFEKIIETRNY